MIVSELCQRCRNLKLSAADFVVPAGEQQRNPEANDVHDPIVLDVRPWDYITQHQYCNLCSLIRLAVEASRHEWQALETLSQCKIVSKRLNGSHIKGSDTRVLEVIADYDWSSSHDVCLVPAQSDHYPTSFPGRRIDPDAIDPVQVKRWIDQCQLTHGEKCKHSETHRFKALRPDMLVIDIHDQCLAKLPLDSRYVALSYVWGGVKQPETTLTTLHTFSQQGALARIRSALPKVIIDAMAFATSLGERYLWVDVLCIIQDDYGFKQSMIDRMHVIYENAYLTLFAAAGNNSNAGLPGVQRLSRTSVQAIAPISPGLGLIFPFPYRDIKKSAWSTRGWT